MKRGERELYQKGINCIVGIDEVGRGALAGPVGVGAVIFPRNLFFTELLPTLRNIRDSKKLSPKQRSEYAIAIRQTAIFSETVYPSRLLIDRVNINKAIELGIIHLIRRIQCYGIEKPYLLVDGNYRFLQLQQNFSKIQYESIVKGDDRIFSIAAASIIAKVGRDQRMKVMAKIYPDYYWGKNKGYGSLQHRQQICLLGLSNLHRRSYCRRLLQKDLTPPQPK